MIEAATMANTNPNKIDVNSMIDKLLKLDLLGKRKSKFNENDYLELLYKLYEIVDLTKLGTIEKLDGIESFIISLDTLLAYLKSLNLDSKCIDKLERFTKNKQNKLFDLINGDYSNESICVDLENILKELDRIVQSFVKGEVNVVDLSNEKSDIDFTKLDNLYKELYSAIERNDVKKITLYRGRLIRALKSYNRRINKSYEEVKVLEAINNLLNSGENVQNVLGLLEDNNDSKYRDYLEQFVDNKEQFLDKFYKLYEAKKVNKIVLYKNALREELKEHGKVLNERYSEEFLDKKAKWNSIGTMLPNAVSLAVKKLSNSINELREAKTNRRKIAKLIEVAKDTGKVIGTPIMYVGKFVASNWYAFYALYKGFLAAGKVKENENTNTNDTELRPDLENENLDNDMVNEEKADTGLNDEVVNDNPSTEAPLSDEVATDVPLSDEVVTEAPLVDEVVTEAPVIGDFDTDGDVALDENASLDDSGSEDVVMDDSITDELPMDDVLSDDMVRPPSKPTLPGESADSEFKPVIMEDPEVVPGNSDTSGAGEAGVDKPVIVKPGNSDIKPVIMDDGDIQDDLNIDDDVDIDMGTQTKPQPQPDAEAATQPSVEPSITEETNGNTNPGVQDENYGYGFFYFPGIGPIFIPLNPNNYGIDKGSISM